MVSFFDIFFVVEGELGVYFGGDLFGNVFEDFCVKIDCQFIVGVSYLCFVVVILFFGSGDSVVDEVVIGCQVGGFQQQRGVGGGVFWMVVVDGFDVFVVGDYCGELFDVV